MKLAFDMPAVRQWADFSGDYNPIHFDLAHARVAGLDALIVHGMLALIPIKQALADAYASDARTGSSPWTKFRAHFRTPIAHDSVNILAMRQAAGGINFNLSDADSGAERFRGGYGPASAVPAESNGGVAVERECPIDNTRLERFAELYADVAESWIALDAAVFSDFLRTKLDIVSAAAERELARLAGGSLANKKVVVQTSHTVYVDTAALSWESPGIPDWGCVAYDMLEPVMVGGSGQVSGSVLLPVRRNGQLVMLMEVGLLAKVSTETTLT